MPEQSSVTSFVTAVKTRQTNTTKRLQHLWDDRANLSPPARAAFDGFLDGSLGHDPLHADLVALLQDPANGPNPLSNDEILHINQWPRHDKEEVRDALNDAVAAGENVGFFWETYRGKKSRTAVTPGAGSSSVTFRSPVANVREDGPTTGNIVVDI